MFPFLKYRKIYYILSGTLVLASLVCIIIFGLKLNIDFTGGSILEIEYQGERPSNQEISEKLGDFDLGDIYIQPTGDRGVILKMKDISEEVHQQILKKLNEGNKEISGENEDVQVIQLGEEESGVEVQAKAVVVEETGSGEEEREIELKSGGSGVKELRFESIGPAIGEELKQKTKLIIFLSLLGIVIYIALAFRKIRQPVKSWKYGLVSLVALFHDILIPLGVFSILGKFNGIEISIPIVTALLVIVGYSINDTVVVFDRIRENLLKTRGLFEEIVNKSINQSIGRQIKTSLTTLFVAIAIFLFGGATLKYFALALILGIIAGTYSSAFLASPLLFSWYLRQEKKRI